MTKTRIGLLLILLAALLSQPVAADDNAALQAGVAQFFTAYAQRDLDRFMALWSPRSPELASRRQAMQQLFAGTKDFLVKSLAVRRLTISGDAATVRVVVEMRGTDAKTGRPAPGFGRMNRTFHWAREAGGWKLWSYRSSEDELAAALTAAKTDADRDVLLAADSDLVTPALVGALLEQASRRANEQGHPPELSLFTLAARLAEQCGDKPGAAAAQYDIGMTYDLQGDYPHALAFYQQSLRLEEALGDPTGIERALHNIGIVYEEQGSDALALAAFQRSLKLEQQLGDRAGMARTLGQIGVIEQDQGNYGSALAFHQQSLSLDEALGDKDKMARSLGNMAIIHDIQGDYAAALDAYQQCFKLEEALKDQAGIAQTWGNMGVVEKEEGNYPKALEDYQRALKTDEQLGDRAGIAGNLNNIGGVHEAQGDYAQAMEYYQRSLTLEKALGQTREMAAVLGSIANLESERGNYPLSLAEDQDCLALWQQLGDQAGTAEVLGNIGVVYKYQGNYNQALKYYQESMKLEEALGNKLGLAHSLLNIGVNLRLAGQYAQALSYYQQGLKLEEAMGDKAGIDQALNDIGNVYYSLRNYPQALAYQQKALTLAQAIGHMDTAYRCQGNIGSIQAAEGHVPAAIGAYQQAIRTIESLRGQVGGGAQEQERFFEDKLDPYYALVGLLVGRHQPAAALADAERAKARVLLDVLHSGRVRITRAMTAAERQQEQTFNAQLTSLDAQLGRESGRAQPDATRLAALHEQRRKARLAEEAFRLGLYAAHPELKAQRGEAPPLTLADAGALLPNADSALVEYVVTGARSYLFVLTRSAAGEAVRPPPIAIRGGTYKTRLRRLGRLSSRGQGAQCVRSNEDARAPVALAVYTLPIPRAALTELAERFRLELSLPGMVYAPTARHLYDLLLRPAAARLRGKTALVIVPDGPLWELPFQALQPRRGHYLLESCAVSYAPSLAALRELREFRKRAPRPSAAESTLLAVGNPVVGKPARALVQMAARDASVAPLPNAEKEVEAVARLYGPAHSRVYVEGAAREATVKAAASRCRVLHFATHGFLDDTNPMYSYLLLAPDAASPQDNGLLAARDIVQMDLHADLAVLSACETARGRIGAGEGVIGLSWAFFVAGCPTTVVSQWKVADASTMRLMVAFHRSIQSIIQLPSGQPKSQTKMAAALRAAELKLLHDPRTAQPYYWAPIVLVGDGG